MKCVIRVIQAALAEVFTARPQLLSVSAEAANLFLFPAIEQLTHLTPGDGRYGQLKW